MRKATLCIKFIHVVSLHENTICNAIHYEYKFLMCQKHVLGTRDTEHYYYIADKTHLSIIMHILCEHVIVIKKNSLPTYICCYWFRIRNSRCCCWRCCNAIFDVCGCFRKTRRRCAWTITYSYIQAHTQNWQ